MTARRLLFALVVAGSLVVLFAPADDVPGGLPPGTDKVVHTALFAALAWSGLRAVAGPGAVLAALTAYAVLSEVVQGLLGRSRSGTDVLADLVGLALGWLLWRRTRER